MSPENILEIRNLVKTYSKSSNQKGEGVLDNFNLTIKQKEFVCILGPSGCGKTTLLRCIAGFENYEGEIISGGKKIKQPDIDRMMVFQDFNQLFPWKTVSANVQYPLMRKGIKGKKLLESSSSYISLVGLSGDKNKYPHQLSGGMKQRVAIAKALAIQPQIILMDEPFAALDAITRTALQTELRRIFDKTECTFIFVTHNIQETMVLGDRIIVMSKSGRICVDEVNRMARPVTPASDGYGNMWDRLHEALERASNN